MAIRSLQEFEKGAVDDTGSQPTPSARRRILVGTIGTAIEWYDFFIYGLVGPLVFDQLFFPKFDQLTADARGVRDLCRRLPGPAARRRGLRSFRRSHRPQVRTPVHALDDGAGDDGNRPSRPMAVSA